MKIYIIIFYIFSCLFFVGCSNNIEENIIKDHKRVNIKVYVCGEVKFPGVYKLKNDSRICDAIEKAGGFSNNANVNFLNQAEKLVDEMQVYVPSKYDKTDDKDKKIKKININMATEKQLLTLKGIGKLRAEQIIKYRHKNRFKNIRDIMKISGIKTKLFNKIKDDISV